MSVTSQEDDGVMGGDERKRKIRSKSLSGPKLEGGNLEKGQYGASEQGCMRTFYSSVSEYLYVPIMPNSRPAHRWIRLDETISTVFSVNYHLRTKKHRSST